MFETRPEVNMHRKRLIGLLGSGFLIVSLFAGVALPQTSTAQIRPTEKPFLWRIEGTVPSYLYGTIHVPDPAVLELPDVVKRALDSADVFNGEIPLDPATQAGVVGKVMLPAGLDLRTLAGDELFGRLTRALTSALGDTLPPGSADLMAGA